MDKNHVIRVLSQVIKDICDRDESTLILQDKKIKFRQYERSAQNENRLQAIDVTVEF